jgi:hypothetical protein
MELIRFVLVVASAGTVSTLTDFALTGGWIQKRLTDPAAWHGNHGGRAALLAGLLPFFTCAVFAYTANRLAIGSVHAAVKLAVAIWTIGPLPLILTNTAFIKFRWPYALTYALAWLIKLMVIAVLVGKFIR